METAWRSSDLFLTRKVEDSVEVTGLSDAARRFRFLDFELDVGAYELRRDGRPVRIERQPMDLLLLLVERRGLLVSRSEIVDRLWGKDVFVDVDTGVHTAVRKVRLALRDSPEEPRCVETVPGKGYRFIAEVEAFGATNGAAGPTIAVAPRAETPSAPDVARAVGAPTEPVAAELPGLTVGPAPAPAVLPWRRRFLAGSPAGIGAGLAVALTFLVVTGVWIRRPSHAVPGTSPLILAVLPVANLSGDPERGYLADGLAEDTAAALGQVDPKQVGVVARTSMLQYRGSTKSVAEIGRELNADYLVESSLRAEAGRIRMTVTLVRVRDQVRVWSQSYDREPTSFLGLQQELSRTIAQQIQLRLSPNRLSALVGRQTQSPDAYDLYLRGRNFQNQRTPSANQRALEYFTRATDIDPNYALAWAAISSVLAGSLVNGDAAPSDVVPRAWDAARRAVTAGPDAPEAQFALAYLQWCCEWDWPSAEMGLRRAVALDPRFAMGHLVLGHALSQRGQHAEAQASTRRARELDPLSAHMAALSAQVAFQARDYRAALEHADQAIVLDPEFWIGHIMRGAALEQLGAHDDAVEALTTAARFSGENSKALSLRAYILARNGRQDEARGMLRTLEQVAESRYVPPYAMAVIHAGLGERESALTALERAYAMRDMHLIYLPVDPIWDSYRRDPRFEGLIVRCGFRRTSGSALSP
jgi:TolB-like protein/DNA-binding winged helix-turn-helix (wHTH) protein/Flp pilus assembly protein TadD